MSEAVASVDKAYPDPGPILDWAPSRSLRLPLRGRVVTVRDGARVAARSLLAKPTHAQDVALFAPVAGIVRQEADALALEPTSEPVTAWFPRDRPANAAALLDALRDRGVVGLGGAGFPTHLKFAAPLTTLIVNAVECEPGVSADQAVLETRAEALVTTLGELVELLQPRDTVIAIAQGNQRARGLLAPRAEAFRLADAPAAYPAGSERQLVAALTGSPLAPGERPAARGIACINLSTLAAIADALEGIPLTHRVVTLGGPACAKPGNYRLPFGLPIRDVARELGDGRQATIRTGGGLTGSLAGPDEVVGYGTIAIELLPGRSERTGAPCIRCGDCAPVCPERLQPQRLLESLPEPGAPSSGAAGLEACLLCGACTAVCPSAIPLNDLFSVGRAALLDERRADAAASRSKARYERHVAREAARAERKAAELRARRRGADAKSLIAAAQKRRK